MGHHVFRLPDVGEGVAEAEIVAWHISVGDRIEEDQPTVDLMTDKATVEMTTPVSGVVVARHGEIGQRMPVGSPLVEVSLDAAGDEADDGPGDGVAADPAPSAIPGAPAVSVAPAVPVVPGGGAAKPATLAAPATRRRAHALGIELQAVPGSGPAGRVTREDLEAFVADRPAAPLPSHGVTEVRIVGLRRRIAERMQEATRRIPHFSYVEEFDCTELEALRQALNAEVAGTGRRLTLLPFFMRAIVLAVRQFPRVNARYDDEAGILRLHQAVHVGIATQSPDGLMVPVVRDADRLDLWRSADELKRVTEAARSGGATRDMLSGSTITLSSLGALGGISATPIINHPEVAIIGPNKLVERPMIVGGQVAIRRMMNVSSSFDHRIVDGHDAASFIQAIKRLVERPALLFVTAP